MSIIRPNSYPADTDLKATPSIALVKPIQVTLSSLKMLAVLFKLRVVVLLLFAAVGGAFLGAGGWPGASALVLLLISGGLAACGASAINQYLERNSDALMTRTQRRPLVDGSLRPGWVPYVGALMIFVPALAVLPSNPALTFFLLLGAAIYIGIYTMWLKPRTLLNIVIGGAAGSAAVLSGSAAVGDWNNPGAVVLALMVFLWTPTHFWSLAIVYRNDYARSNTPMLPVQTSLRQAAFWVLLHTAATAFAALVLVMHPVLGCFYLVPVGLATVDLIGRNVRLLVTPSPKLALSLFKASNIYLTLVLLLVCVDTLV